MQRGPRARPGRTSSSTSTAPTSRPAPTSSRPTPSAGRRSSSPSTGSPSGCGSSTAAPPSSPGPAVARGRGPGTAALRRRLDGPDHEGDLGHRRGHLRRAADAYAEQALGLLEGGVDLFLVETCQDTAQRQGGADRGRAGARRGRGAPPGGGLGDHRGVRDHARRAERRGVRGLARAPRPALHRAQLRDRPGADGRPPAHPARAGHDRRLPASRTPACPTRTGATARRRRASPRRSSASSTRGWLNLVGGCCGTTERARRAPSRRWSRASGRARSRPRGRGRVVLLRHRAGRARRRTTARCWSASGPTSSARASFAAAGRGGALGRGGRGRPGAGAGRRAGPRRLPAVDRARRGRRRAGASSSGSGGWSRRR